MHPFFFGRSDQPVYGVYHPPGMPSRPLGFVFCAPLGQEYVRVHRALRQLADQLATNGAHVLRFDYRGTGDSYGELEDAAVSAWLEDAANAVEELKALGSLNRVSVMGLRFGALIASHLAAARKDIDGLAVWDPILSGSAAATEMAAYVQEESRRRPIEIGREPEPGNFVSPDGSIHFNGFDFPATFLEDIKSLDLLPLDLTGTKRLLQVVSHESDDFGKLKSAWQSHKGYAYRLVEASHDWNYASNDGDILLPHTVLGAIKDWAGHAQ